LKYKGGKEFKGQANEDRVDAIDDGRLERTMDIRREFWRKEKFINPLI